jgi:type IV pilus assembly protein PilM
MFSWLRRQRSLVGLDIGSTSLKAVQLEPSRSAYRLVALGIAAIPRDTIVEGIIMDAPALSTAIRQLFADSAITVNDVAISVSGHSVIIKKITVPKMKMAELREGITWEAEQHIPYAIDDVNLDFQVLSGTGAGDKEMDVLLVAAKKDTINEYCAVVGGAGLKTVVVDVDAFALENAWEVSNGAGRDEVVALVNVGAAITTINVVQRGVSEFTRDSALAGNRYTESLQKNLGVTHEQAEALKTGSAESGHDVERATPVIEAVTGELAEEIRRSFEFHAGSTQRRPIDRVLLSGGCARLPNLASALAQALDLPVDISNPFRNIAADAQKFDPEYLAYIAPQMAVGVGLAVRRPGDSAS